MMRSVDFFSYFAVSVFHFRWATQKDGYPSSCIWLFYLMFNLSVRSELLVYSFALWFAHMNGRIVEIVEHNLLHYQRMEMRKTLQQRTHKRDDCKHKRKITYSIFMIACAGCKDAAVSCAIFRRKFGRANVIFASEPANNRTEIADHGKMNSTSLAVAVKLKLHERRRLTE